MIVRELVNRIGFQVNRGDRANAEKAFSDLKGQAGGVISFAKGIGNAISIALKSMTALTVAGSAFHMQSEKDDATIKFFSRTREEAELLLDAYEKLRGGTEIISDRELKKALTFFSQMNVDGEGFEKIFSILKNINIANPSLGGFDSVTEQLKAVVEGGDLDALRKFGAIGKEMAEAYSLANIDMSDTVKGQQNRFDLLYELLEKNKERFQELADDRRGTNDFAFRGMTKELSDFTLKFGETTAPQIKELMEIVRDTIKELNDSESFWVTVKGAFEVIRDVFEYGDMITKVFGGIFKWDFTEFNKQQEEFERRKKAEGAKTPVEKLGGAAGSAFSMIPTNEQINQQPGVFGMLFNAIRKSRDRSQQDIIAQDIARKEVQKALINVPEKTVVEDQNMGGFDASTIDSWFDLKRIPEVIPRQDEKGGEKLRTQIDVMDWVESTTLVRWLTSAVKAAKSIPDSIDKGIDGAKRGGEKLRTQIDVSGRIVVEGKNLQGIDAFKLENLINSQIEQKITEPFKMIAAANDTLVSPGR